MQGCVGQNPERNEQIHWEEIPEIQPIEIRQDIIPIAPVITTTAYTVRQGDTLTGIAVRYGLRWQDVVAVNPGISPNRLRIGQVIQLPGKVDLSRTAAPRVTPPAPAPSRTETVYVVKSGDSLSAIALKHGVKVDDIRKANDLKDANKIVVGQRLKIPGATRSTATVAPAPRPTATPPRVTPPRAADVKVDAPVAPVTLPARVEEDAPPVLTPDPEPTPTPTAAPAPAGNRRTHTVRAGEDVYTVAVRWGVSPSDLRALNNLASPDLQEGMVLELPPSASAQ